jgi:acyl-coenzyme A synthetase/AMP-(fatty) acid ligase
MMHIVHSDGRYENSFSYNETGKINIDYEAIDRHADRNAKIILHCGMKMNQTRIIYFFHMKTFTNKAAIF